MALLLTLCVFLGGGIWLLQRWRACALRYDEAGEPLPVVALTGRFVWSADEPLPWGRGPSKRALKAFSTAYRADAAEKMRPRMIRYAVSRAEELDGTGASLEGALQAVEEKRLPLYKAAHYSWLPCYVELVRYKLKRHWAIRVAWGHARAYRAGPYRGESLGHLADYLVTATPPHRIVAERSCR